MFSDFVLIEMENKQNNISKTKKQKPFYSFIYIYDSNKIHYVTFRILNKLVGHKIESLFKKIWKFLFPVLQIVFKQNKVCFIKTR